MEEFVTEEEEPWYDQRDLEQGEAPFLLPRCAGSLPFQSLVPLVRFWDE